MSLEDRMMAVAELGFTERQARFLVHVMLFGGLCLPRQYARFAGTAYGHNVSDFFAKLVQRGHASEWRCLHNRGRVYHVHDRRLYEAIGEGRSHHRRPVPAAHVIPRLMRLDSVIAHRDLRWLSSEEEKVAMVRRLVPAFPSERLPHLPVGVGTRRRLRLFPNDVLVGLDEARGPLFVYVVTTPIEEEWRTFAQRYADLFGALPRWTIRACFPPELRHGMSRFHVVIHEELAEPLPLGTLSELRWYFEQLRDRTRRTGRADQRFQNAQVMLFAAARFRVLYRRWLIDGDAALEVATSHRITDGLGEAGHVNCVQLPVSYRHLSPLVSPGRAASRGVETGVEQGDGEGDDGSARPQPPRVDLDESDPSGCARDWDRLMNTHKQPVLQ